MNEFVNFWKNNLGNLWGPAVEANEAFNLDWSLFFSYLFGVLKEVKSV